MNTFFKMLKTIEELSSEEVLSKDKDLILRKLIAFVESGVCTDSQIEKFIMKNFRLSSVKITEEWNKIHFDREKNTNTFRGQVSLCSRYLSSLFGVSPDGLFEAFLGEGVDTLQRISDILDAYSIGNDNFAKRFPIIVQGGFLPADAKTESTYRLEECLKEIQLLKSLDNSNIEALISEVDRDKLIYVLQSVREPLVVDFYEKHEGRAKNVKKASVNLDKLKFCRAFAKTKAKVLEPVESRKVPVSKQEPGVLKMPEDSKPYKLGLSDELMKVLTDYVAGYDALPVEKKNEAFSESTDSSVNLSRNFLKILTADGFRQYLQRLNPFDLASELENYKA